MRNSIFNFSLIESQNLFPKKKGARLKLFLHRMMVECTNAISHANYENTSKTNHLTLIISKNQVSSNPTQKINKWPFIMLN